MNQRVDSTVIAHGEIVIVTNLFNHENFTEKSQFFFAFCLPYLICVVVAYYAARVLYGLGRELSHAREMGSYRLGDLIGRGGMGEVWRAQHKMLARPAAIKLIRSANFSSDPGAWEQLSDRFEKEAQATAELQSPHTL